MKRATNGQLNIYMDTSLIDQLHEEAERNCLRTSAMARKIIAEYLQAKPQVSPTPAALTDEEQQFALLDELIASGCATADDD